MKCGTKTVAVVGIVGLAAAILAYVLGKKKGLKEASLAAQ